MYDIQKLEELALDEEFVTQVHQLSQELFAAGVVRNVREVTPLGTYGPQSAGSALRLIHLPSLADLGQVPELAGRWSRLRERVMQTEA
jgi:hypothetical protein